MSNSTKSYQLCLACLKVTRRRARTSRCSSCGYEFDPSSYERVASYAQKAVHFGFQYRRTFEEDVAAGRDTRPAIGLDDALLFAGIAAVSGIIGNLSTDVVRWAVAKLLNRRGASTRTKAVDPLVFIAYIEEFHLHGISRLPPEVADRVVEEILVDERVSVLTSSSGGGAAPTAEMVAESGRVALRNALSIRPPMNEDVSAFARNADKSPIKASKSRSPRAKKKGKPGRT